MSPCDIDRALLRSLTSGQLSSGGYFTGETLPVALTATVVFLPLFMAVAVQLPLASRFIAVTPLYPLFSIFRLASASVRTFRSPPNTGSDVWASIGDEPPMRKSA